MSEPQIQEKDQFEELIQGLIDKQYGCCSDFLQPLTLTGLRDNLNNLNLLGKMALAGIGKQTTFRKDDLIRSDKVKWIANESNNAHEMLYLQKIVRFKEYLNKTCFTSIKTVESHYANFEIGSFYKRHLDQFKSEKGRKYSIILYLNQDWKEEDEGLLSLYPSHAEQSNISPIGGRLVFFKSDEMEHEVHPSTTRERSSIAGWMKN